MDEPMIRQQLEEVKRSLATNEEERQILLHLLKGYEGWLRLHYSPNGVAQHQMFIEEPKLEERTSTPSMPTSTRQAVLKVLKDARGEPLHVREIWRRAQALGAKSTLTKPHSSYDRVTDLTCYSLAKNMPVRKKAPRTWAWEGNNEN